MHTARQASLRMIDSPVHDALPCSIDSLGLWLGALRSVEYFTLSFPYSSLFSFCVASAGVLHDFTIGRHSSQNSLRQPSRFSSTLAYGSTLLRNSSSGMS